MLAHNLLHIVITIVAIILVAVSVTVYNRTRRRRFLYVCAGFFVYGIKAIVLAVNIAYFNNPTLEITSHGLDLLILALFFIGLLMP